MYVEHCIMGYYSIVVWYTDIVLQYALVEKATCQWALPVWKQIWIELSILLVKFVLLLSLSGFMKFLCRRSVGFYSRASSVFLMKESKKRRWKKLGKLMAKSCSQPVNLPGARPLMNPVHYSCFLYVVDSCEFTQESNEVIYLYHFHFFLAHR